MRQPQCKSHAAALVLIVTRALALSCSGAEPVYVRAPRRPPLERELYRNARAPIIQYTHIYMTQCVMRTPGAPGGSGEARGDGHLGP